MTFPSRRNIGYRHDLQRAIFFASIWSAVDLYEGKDGCERVGKYRASRRILNHRNRAWCRLWLFGGVDIERMVHE